jgi:hypothetical protein
MAEKTLASRNGAIGCTECGRIQPGAKIGDDCANCIEYGDRGTIEVLKKTVLGPVNTVKNPTWNPLLDAATILRLDGWVAGDYVCEEGKKCLAGAIRAACGIFADPDMEEMPLAEKYIKTKAYAEGKRRVQRALIALANTIPDTTGYGTITDPAAALDKVTSYNDSVLNNEGGALEAIKLLRKAAKNFNPRLRLRSDLWS